MDKELRLYWRESGRLLCVAYPDLYPVLPQLWDLTAGKMMSEFPGHTGPVNVVEFHPNEYLLASGSSDR